MSMTFAQLQSRVRQQLLGFTKDQEQFSYLTADMTASDTTFRVDTETIDQLSAGLVEIGDELLLVKKFDRTTGLVTVMADTNGRGREGTTAATHATNDLVISDPLFSKAVIKQACVDAIQGIYPDIPVFAQTTVTKTAPVFEYELPSTVEEVWQVNADTVGPSKVNFAVQKWRLNVHANTDRFPSGKSIQVLDSITPGRKIRIAYTKPPTNPVNDSDDLASTTGYSSADIDRFSDLLTYGAVARLLPAYESARLQQGAIESMERANLVPVTSASKAAQYYWQLYKTRIEEERVRVMQLRETLQHFNS
jgi:hypothetical protein